MAPRFSKNGKRLGRPPKNKEPVKTKKKKHEEPAAEIEFNPQLMISCKFLPITQYGKYGSSEDKKDGIYSSCIYSNIEDLGWTRWPVRAYLTTDFNKYRKQGLSDQEIVERCVNFLNATEPRKKYAKKDPVPKYGKIELIKKEVKFLKKEGVECIDFIFTTNERKNKNFWFEGEKANL